MQLSLSSDNDQNFDGLVEHFESKIYGSLKGKLRLQLIKQDLLKQYPQLTTQKLRILDVAGGLGQIATWLAAMGHEVVIADISLQMIQRSKQLAEQTQVEQPIKWLHSPLQDLHKVLKNNDLQQPFDLIIAHAILEWMDQPKQGFDAIVNLASAHTSISLTFYNYQAIVLHNVLKGNFHKVNSDNFRGEVGGLTPLNPLKPDTVRSWIADTKFKIQSQTGLRCFYDYLVRDKKQKISEQDIFDMENKLSSQQPFIDMARYLHLFLSL